MLDAIQDNSAETDNYLVNTVKTLKVPEYEGKNFETFVSLVHWVASILSNLVYTSGQITLPDNFDSYLLEVFNTTSVTKFNMLFSHYRISMRLTELHTKTSKKPCISEILLLEETQYYRLYLIVQRSSINTKINATSFTAITNGNYLNCGENHSLKNYRKPQNEEHIKAKNKLFYEQKNKGKGKSGAKKVIELHKKGKWDPPTNSENKNRGNHNIDGKGYYYHYKGKPLEICGQSSSTYRKYIATCFGHHHTTVWFWLWLCCYTKLAHFSIPIVCPCHRNQSDIWYSSWYYWSIQITARARVSSYMHILPVNHPSWEGYPGNPLVILHVNNYVMWCFHSWQGGGGVAKCSTKKILVRFILS